MNALFAASRYLGRNQTVVLVDQKPRAGGMWHTAYDYVRLHQPHPLFTAGNIRWTSGQDRMHLATRAEIVEHLRHCLETLRKRVLLDERYGYAYVSHDETSDPHAVSIHCEAVAEGAPALRIRAKRLVKAFGYNIQDSAPLALSSSQVHSIAPNGFDLRGPEMRASSAPVYIVGGGKTGTDTAYTLIDSYPGRQVNLLIGEGMMFGRRDKFFPGRLKRYVAGDTPVASFLDLARRFDGRNERDVLELFRSRYGVSLLPNAQRFGIGLLSVEENDRIVRGAHAIIPAYLKDVVDRDAQPTLIFRDGESRPVAPGSWFINCTGYLFKNRSSYEPYVSPSGKVVSVQPSSAIHFLSTCSSYLLVHLAYLNKLQDLPLYEVDYGELNRKSRDALGCVIMSHTLYNAGVLMSALPLRVESEFGTNMEHWYPWHRRILDAVRVVSYLKRHPDHLRRTLDVIRERFDVRCGPLQHRTRVEAPQLSAPASHLA
jgi:hypothetical protein